MSKRRRLIVIIAAVAALLGIIAAAALLIASRKVVSYGTAARPSAYAPAVRQMVAAQQQLADALAAKLAAQADAGAEVQQSFDHRSVQASSYLAQLLGTSNCPIGQVRYADVLNLSVTTAEQVEVSTLLDEVSADGSLSSGEVDGTAVSYPAGRFRIDVSAVDAGDRTTLRLSVPNLPDAADAAAYACYPTPQVPLSSVQQLG